MSAYRSEYLLKNPFLGSSLLQKANQGFQGAKEMLESQKSLYAGALAAGAGTRQSYLDQVMPVHLAQRTEAEKEIETQSYSQAHRMQNVNEINARLSQVRRGGGAEERGQAALSGQQGLVSRHAGLISNEEYKMNKLASQRNRFFGGSSFGGAGGRRAGDFASDISRSRTTGMEKKFKGEYGQQYPRWLKKNPEEAGNILGGVKRSVEAFNLSKWGMRPYGMSVFTRAKNSRLGAGYGTGLNLAANAEDSFTRGLNFSREQLAGTNPLYMR